MHRSASEGYMRPHLKSQHGAALEGPMLSSGTNSGENRAGSASGMQEEESYKGRAAADPRGLLAPRMNEMPDFAMIYAFLGSMFDPVIPSSTSDPLLPCVHSACRAALLF